jgi:hypothetical protein
MSEFQPQDNREHELRICIAELLANAGLRPLAKKFVSELDILAHPKLHQSLMTTKEKLEQQKRQGNISPDDTDPNNS